MIRRAALLASAFVALGAAPTPFAPGVSFIIKSSTIRDGTATPNGEGTRVQALNGVLRFEGEEKQSSGGKGSYVLVNPGVKTLSIVMPEHKQYMEIKFEDSTAQALGAMASVMGSTTLVSDIEVSGSALGGGGTVNGYSTQRYRINTSYAEAAASGEAQRKVRMEEEFWVTTDLKDIPDPMESFTRAFGGKNGMPKMGGTLNDLMKKRGDAQRKLFTGLPIRSVVKSTFTERDGTKHEETTTTDIVDLKKTDLDAANFRVPEGYTLLDMKALTAMGDQMGEALKGFGIKEAKQEAKEGAKDAASDAAKDAAKSQADAAKDKAKCALGGLLGRKKC